MFNIFLEVNLKILFVTLNQVNCRTYIMTLLTNAGCHFLLLNIAKVRIFRLNLSNLKLSLSLVHFVQNPGLLLGSADPICAASFHHSPYLTMVVLLPHLMLIYSDSRTWTASFMFEFSECPTWGIFQFPFSPLEPPALTWNALPQLTYPLSLFRWLLICSISLLVISYILNKFLFPFS